MSLVTIVIVIVVAVQVKYFDMMSKSHVTRVLPWCLSPRMYSCICSVTRSKEAKSSCPTALPTVGC